MKINPVKRSEFLRTLSVDHHHGLLLCWKIKTGFSKGVSPERMMTYASWFYESHLEKHFEIEEKYVFPVLGNDHELIRQAIEEHRKLTTLFHNTSDPVESLNQIQVLLDQHIRFEERVLFNEIEKSATKEELALIAEQHGAETFADNTEDVFWT